MVFGGEPETTHSIEQGVCKLISDYITTPIRRNRSQDQTYPVITYDLNNVEYGKLLKRLDGTGDAEFAVTIWSTNYDDLASIGAELRDLLDDFAGMAWDRIITFSYHDKEADELQRGNDGSQRIIYGRTQFYKMQFVEPQNQ